MIISYNWLQSYFKEKLPAPEKVAELLIFHAFEVESIEKKGSDIILDVKVLPDRAHDALSHRGIARELAVHLGTNIVDAKKLEAFQGKKPLRTLSINVQDPALCRRYAGRIIEGVKVKPSPEWLIERLTAIGQKSINNIVDATNFVMFDIGQPLHAFDADKADGGVIVRNTEKGEKITTLDCKEVPLDSQTLIIADSKSPLAIAGIKGGKVAEINTNTTSIILEAANFSPTNIRKTSRRLGIQTDSSKRFENEQSPEGVGEAMEKITALIAEIAGGKDTKIGDVIDIYPHVRQPYKIGISVSEVNKVLGATLTKKDIIHILDRFAFKYEKIKNPLEKILEVSASIVGSVYKRPSAMQFDSPLAFSCTSLISYVFVQAGIYMPSLAIDKYVYGTPVERKDLMPGDVVFVNTKEGTNSNAPIIYHETVEWMKGTHIEEGIDHAGIYLGDGNILHTSWKPGNAIIEKLDEAEQFRNIVGYRRFIENHEERFVVTVPHERLDLRIKEDLIEEIGKAYGYDKISPKQLPQFEKVPAINKSFFYAHLVRNILTEEGFSEIYTSSFSDAGDVVVENPIASDKSFLRSDLSSGLQQSLEMNIKIAPLLQSDTIKVFEIGKVFKSKGESLHLAFGVKNTSGYKGDKASEVIKKTCANLSHKLGQELMERDKHSVNEATYEISLDTLLPKLQEPSSYEHVLEISKREAIYKKISSYPFVLRDIAVFVPPSVSERDISSIIKNHAGNLLVREPKLFDRFEKKNKETGVIEKISYAFSLVFQSEEKTLSDAEVNTFMQNITTALNAKSGWQVR